jgi:putative ABC transport system permease protein
MPFEVVGVVQDVRNVPLGQRTEPAFYTSTRQYPFSEVFIAVRASDAATAMSAVREGLRAVAPQVPMAAARTWGERFAARTAEPRLLMVLLLFFGGVAAVLAGLGVYGLLSWAVALRTRELAIRLTLGARPARIGALLIAQTTLLVAVGLVTGLALVRLSQAALSRVLFEVAPSDASSTISATAVLVVAALVACLPPALRAMRVDPVVGLRTE